ncbi:peptidylprolyl isomerase [Neptunomonas japonica]|uniref:peptidylprolyl isomerase n=1 Tax=Neptunomonas japonica TaxID=417574 RepID=UPI00041FB58C|nr:peptidylprolyl isomerase [Neptunomonas japonica]
MLTQLNKLLLITFIFLFSHFAYAQDTTTNPRVALETTAGSIMIELFSNEAPVTVENFLRYIDEGLYVDTQFHRVISGFMIQGGGFTKDLKKKQNHEPIKNESSNGLSNKRGTIAMARTQDPDSATNQFFINLVDNLNLNQVGNRAGYTVFGEVSQGIEVIDKIGKVKTTTRSRYRNVPVDPILILSAKRL